MTMKTMRNLLATLTLAILFASCGKDAMYSRYVDMPDEQWNRDSVLRFDVNVDDSTSVYDISFCNRITGQYQYSNMFLFITIVAPDKSHQTDTLECILADNKGKWLGKGFGNIWSNNIVYKQNVIFPQKGNYSFYIEQAMRIENLPHVLDAGLKIEKTK